MRWRPRSQASRPTSSPRRVIPPNDGNYFSRTCVSNTALGPLRHHSLRRLRFRRVTFSETEHPVYGVLGNSDGTKRPGRRCPGPLLSSVGAELLTYYAATPGYT